MPATHKNKHTILPCQEKSTNPHSPQRKTAVVNKVLGSDAKALEYQK